MISQNLIHIYIYIFLRIFNTFRQLFDKNLQKLFCENRILQRRCNTVYSVIDVLPLFFLDEMLNLRHIYLKCFHSILKTCYIKSLTLTVY